MRAIIFAALLGFALAVPKTSVRRTSAIIENYPFMASMQYGWANIAWAQNCAGTLITNNAVLSAAHCYDGKIPAQWRVGLGSASRSNNDTIFNVARFTFHPSYNVLSLFDADVAIVHLTSNAVFSQTINNAAVASATSIVFPGLPVTSIGWGSEQGNARPEQLQRRDITIINQEICEQQYDSLRQRPEFAGWPKVTAGMACAGVPNEGGRDACVGDEGGPVFFTLDRPILVGIHSWSYGCAPSTYPSVIVRVPLYSNWIVANA
ncbi:unnamed protein product [Arctia plantaginis]|uniref:Peptidase S1 domain-containing protein n=1 Tax=Arctia plantaginis TaxID=874455 RepID=A0A8S1AFD6_ARCPL|nr:unnamed protein product [Arctia plantaginis]CAB3247839.1 unnamed protein product [Arctia plantaginis]